MAFRIAGAAAFLVALLLTPLSSEAGVEISLSVAGQESPGTPLQAHVRAERFAQGVSEPQVKEWKLAAPGSVEADLPPGTAWRVAVTAPGYWAPEATVPEGARSPVHIQLLPVGTITVRLAGESKSERPAALEVRFLSSPGSDGPKLAAARTCPVQADRWECEVPAGTRDLRLRADGLVPLYLWDVRIPPGKRHDLGVFPVLRGASLAGWVEINGLPARQAPVAELRPLLGAGIGSRSGAEQLESRTLTAEVTPRGFFQFRGIPAGRYGVSARLDGFAPSQPVEATLTAGSELELREPVMLHRPLALEVRLDPLVDPYGQPWNLELLQIDGPGSLRRAGAGPSDAAGFWTQPGIASGPHVLRVLDSAGSQWRWEPLEVAPGQPPLELHLEAVAVDGRVLQGKEPVETTLWFERRRQSQKIRFDSDAEGAFSGYLPAEGEWEVGVARPDGQQALEPVRIQKLPNAKSAKVEIRLPRTRLKARVTNERGEPVPEATVIVLSNPEKRRSEAQAQTDGKGEANLSGLVPGVVQLWARKGEASSDWVSQPVEEDREETVASLVLRERIRLRGKVLSPEGPVPGALLVFSPALPYGARGWLGRAASEADGRFELALDRSAVSLGGTLVSAAPGFAVRMVSVAPGWSPDGELAIPVHQNGGALIVDVRELGGEGSVKAKLSRGNAWLPLVGAVVDTGALRQESGLYLFPLMEPGDYALCPAWASPSAACVSGSLAAGGELRLRLGPDSAAPPTSSSTPSESAENRIP